MTNSLTIRPVMREDFPQWLPLWDGYSAFYGRAGATALPDAVTQATWGRFFDVYEPMHALVAEEGKALLSLGPIRNYPNRVAYDCPVRGLPLLERFVIRLG